MINQARIEKAIHQVLNGNLEAFRDIISETSVLLRACISMFVYDHHTVDDVLSEVYVRIYQQIDSYEIGSNFTAWIKAIASNVAMTTRNLSAREKDCQQRYRNEVLDCINGLAQSERNLGMLEEQFQILGKCLGRLESKVRSWVDLYYFRGQPLELVASASGTSVNTVAVGLHRARKALANCMAAEGGKHE